MKKDIEEKIWEILNDKVVYIKYSKVIAEIYSDIEIQIDWKTTEIGRKIYSLMNNIAYNYKYLSIYEIKDLFIEVLGYLKEYEKNLYTI